MKLVHRQTQFAQVDVEVHHHIAGHGRREHFLLVEGGEQRRRRNMERQHGASCYIKCPRARVMGTDTFMLQLSRSVLTLYGQYYVDTRTIHSYVMVEHVTATPRALTCS